MEPHFTYATANAMMISGDVVGDFALSESCADFGFCFAVPQLAEPFIELLSSTNLYGLNVFYRIHFVKLD